MTKIPARPLSVTELNRQVKQLLEVSFLQVIVTGEISNLSTPSSGHWYFTLKDAKAQVRCAMFRNRNILCRKRPANGDKVILTARVSLYEGRGEFQLIGERLEGEGEGALRKAFEALKEKLRKEGLFDQAGKRPLPSLPRKIGIITSPTGAAVQDILKVLTKRFPTIPVELFPVPVQGDAAAPAIVSALTLANRLASCSVLIVGRGGGSLEDLWAFNEESVVRSISASAIPVIAAVGHETDTTLTDLVADWRAPTPSAAAEIAVPDRTVWQRQFADFEQRLFRLMQRHLLDERQRFQSVRSRLKHPARTLEEYGQRLDNLELSLVRDTHRLLEQKSAQWQQAHQRLGRSHIHYQVESLANRLQVSSQKLLEDARLSIKGKRIAMENLVSLLNSVSPLATLGRGYSITRDPQGNVIRSTDTLTPGQTIHTQLASGQVESRIESFTASPSE